MTKYLALGTKQSNRVILTTKEGMTGICFVFNQAAYNSEIVVLNFYTYCRSFCPFLGRDQVLGYKLQVFGIQICIALHCAHALLLFVAVSEVDVDRCQTTQLFWL